MAKRKKQINETKETRKVEEEKDMNEFVPPVRYSDEPPLKKVSFH